MLSDKSCASLLCELELYFVRDSFHCVFKVRFAFRNHTQSLCQSGFAAVLAIALSAAAILLTTCSASATPCRRAIQLGSLYESHVLPVASFQTSAFNGRSIPTVCTDCISGVPPRALPKTMSSVGANVSPTSAAPAA